MKEITFEAKVEKLNDLFSFINQELENAGCTKKALMKIDLAAEELFVNIANYAYDSDEGHAVIRMETDKSASRVEITFIDEGIPYNPLEKENPDISLSAEERPIGGLGIYLVKKRMDDVTYRFEDGKNILTIVSSW